MTMTAGKPRRTAPKGREENKKFSNETLPPALYAIEPPAPSWLNHNKAISRGYIDDACDGFVEVRLTLANSVLKAKARICAGAASRGAGFVVRAQSRRRPRPGPPRP